MSRSQIAERLDAGDVHGAAKLALKQILPEAIAKAQATQVSLDSKIAEAAGQFFARHPELTPADEASALEFGKQMGIAVRRLNLDGSSVEHWESAWTVEQAKRVPARPRQETVAPVKPVPQPSQPADELTNAARALISSVGGDAAFAQIVNDMSSKEMERRMRDFVYQKACEIVFPSAAPSILTRGDLVRGSQVVRAAEISGTDIAAAQAAVVASREAHATAYANYRQPTTTETVDPHYANPMARKGVTAPRRKAYTPEELRQFERANAARSGQPEKSRADAIREAQEAEAKVKAERWSR